jgi:formylglycine-generating enzyme required for sulfatase activity
VPVDDPLRLLGVTLARKYVVETLVRVEASAVVYRATHLRSNRPVAVRVLVSMTVLSGARRRALAEGLARDHAKLAEIAEIAPGAYPLRDVGAVGTRLGLLPFVVLDWPHGVTLRQLVQPGHGAALPESLDEVVAMLEPIAVALALAHERGVVHGGITSDRVLFRDDGAEGARRATLLDFGVARLLRAVEDEGEPTPAGDVRALAAILSQIIARSCGADSRLEEARSPRARGVAVTEELEAVFAGAIEGGSYASVGAFWSALRSALGLSTLRSLQATIPPETPSSVVSRSLRPTAHSTPPSASEVSSSRPAFAIGGLALAALALVTVGVQRATRSARSTVDPAARSAHARLEARPAAAADTCPDGMQPTGGTNVRLGEAGDPDNPPHDVTLHPFCIDRAAVPTGAYSACARRGACRAASPTNEWEGISADDHAVLDPFCTTRDPQGQAVHPVNCLTWEMASAFCAQRGARLPTEAEWELASRSTAASVAEWVADWRAPIAPGGATDPVGPAVGGERVVRGAHGIGASPTRFGAAPTTRSHAIGFRCAKSL